jgi:hypothetical protein
VNVETEISDLTDRLIDQIGSHSTDNREKIVYHYTDAVGLCGILQSGKLFATDVNFLNDKTEFIHGVGRAKNNCATLSERATQLARKDLLLKIKEHLEIPTKGRVFVTSFSSRKDDLSQWRGYANDGMGFTIGFSCEKLAKFGEINEIYHFSKVDYRLRDFDRRFHYIINQYQKIIEPHRGSSNWRDLLDFASENCSLVTNGLAAFQKHSSFLSEREWRVSYFHTDGVGEDEIKVRTSRGNLTPYVELDFGKGGKLPILEIGIGPAFSNPSTETAVHDICNQYGYDVSIYSARTPYIRR